MTKFFAAIDLKSFYASVECNERGLDPLTTNLVVADESRTDKTICLAISPSLKSYGLPGRARLFEVNQKVKTINAERLNKTPLHAFLGKSFDNSILLKNPNLELDFIIATPRMQYYIDYSSKIYNIYLKHLAPEDIFAYSIDEIFCDITHYLKMTDSTPKEFVTNLINDIYRETGITATAGIGTNLFLAKVAMDIVAKHADPDSNGARIATLDEQKFRETLWTHTPITDFWRIGRGSAKRLANQKLYTMGDIARCSLNNPKILYDLFGVNAELIIDHAWGYECVNISDVKSHRPNTKSLSSGQVLSCPYPHDQARTIVKEMAEALSLDLVRKSYITDHFTLAVEYDRENLTKISTTDRYGRRVPKPTHGTIRLDFPTASTRLIVSAFTEFFDTHANPNFSVRKIYVGAENLINEDTELDIPTLEQTDFFTNYYALEQKRQKEKLRLESEKRAQKAILKIRDRYGKNAILRGTNFEAGATERNRHHQIGGHRA